MNSYQQEGIWLDQMIFRVCFRDGAIPMGEIAWHLSEISDAPVGPRANCIVEKRAPGKGCYISVYEEMMWCLDEQVQARVE